MAIQLGASIFPLTLITQPVPAEYLVDSLNQLIELIAQQCSAAVNPGVQPGGATLAVTAAMSGSPILLDNAAGTVATLPAATGSGNEYRFKVKTTTTSGAHKILAASVSDFMNGLVIGENANTCKAFASAAATNHSLQLPFAGSQPSGGFIGDYFDITDIAVNLWQVNGMYQAGTTPTTPFSTATS